MNIIQRPNGNSFDVDTRRGMYEYLVEEMKVKAMSSLHFSLIEELYRQAREYDKLSRINMDHGLKVEKLLLDLIEDIEAYYRNNTDGKILNSDWKAFDAAKNYLNQT